MKRPHVFLGVGILLAGGLLAAAYVSHREFAESITGTFTTQQASFARALEIAVLDHIAEEQEDLLHLVRELQHAGDMPAAARRLLPALHLAHTPDFGFVAILDPRGDPVAVARQGHAEVGEHLERIGAQLERGPAAGAPFLTERFIDSGGRISVTLVVPFTPSGSEGQTYYAVGPVEIEDYMVAHFPSWEGRSMAFVLTDHDGGILSLLNTSHGTDPAMKSGNLLRLSPECLRCHLARDFDEVGRAAAQGRALIQSHYRFPGSGITTNKTTVAFPVLNKVWTLTIFSPLESVERAIARNFRVNLVLAALSLVLVGTLSHLVLHSAALAREAASTRTLRATQESLEKHSRKLEEANRLKDLFTDIVRHDLMSRVAAVRGFMEILASAEHDPAHVEVFGAMRASLGRLRDLIENAATISKLEEVDALEVREMDLGEIVDSAVGSLPEAVSGRHVALVRAIEGVHPVRANPLLVDVFTNLLANAVKYSRGEPRVEVGVRGAGGSWVAYVKDWGVGIAEKHKEQVFHRFERLGKEGIKGSGLGLAIVKRIVDLHGGRVWVEDNPEGGSVFCVSLPKSGPAVA